MMKEKFNFLQIIILTCVFFILETACEETPQESSSVIATESILTETTTLAVETTATSHATTVITELSTNCIITSDMTDDPILEAATYEERQIVAAILMDLFGYGEQSALHDADDNYAETLSERVLGKVTSEEDAIEKARGVLIEKNGIEYIEEIESDFVEVNGEKMKYQRTFPPYTVVFYDAYDVWLVNPNPPSGIREDGVKFATPAMPPYVMIRGSDGKVLAVF